VAGLDEIIIVIPFIESTPTTKKIKIYRLIIYYNAWIWNRNNQKLGFSGAAVERAEIPKGFSKNLGLYNEDIFIRIEEKKVDFDKIELEENSSTTLKICN
jgi:hypothetical protein